MPIFKSLFVAFLMVYASGCFCTEVGCEDGVNFNLKKTSGAWEPGKYTFAVTADGAKSSCTVDIPVVADAVCSTGLQLTIVAAATDASSQAPDPQSLFHFGASAQVTLTISRDGVDLATGTFKPAYVKNEPNGATCGPTCMSATEELTVP